MRLAKLILVLLSSACGLTESLSHAQVNRYPQERNAIYRQNLDFVSHALSARAEHLNQLTADLVDSHQGPLEKFAGQPYHRGDNWDVLAYYEVKSITPSLSSAEMLKSPQEGKTSTFHYQVTALSPLTLEVTETAELGTKKTDPGTKSLTLVFDSEFREISKTYHTTDRGDVHALIGGMHTRLLPLEIYELEAPDLAESSPIPYQSREELMGSLPPAIAAVSQSIRAQGLIEDPAHSKWMQTTDGFGRSIEFLWQSGEPWASYLKTQRGISILIRSSVSASP